MAGKKFNFWQDHSLHYLEMALNRDKRETIENPDGYGIKTGECGDTVEFFLTLKDNIIISVSFNINGCMNTNACSNVVASLAEGKTIDKAWSINPEAVVEYLETLQPEEIHCAELAVGAFYLALSNCQKLIKQKTIFSED